MISDVIVSVLMVTGAALALVAALGLQRFPDVFARMHAATKPATLGLLLIAVAASIALAEPAAIGKLALAVILQFVTAPVAAHMVGRAAYHAGGQLSDQTAVDELDGVVLDRPARR